MGGRFAFINHYLDTKLFRDRIKIPFISRVSHNTVKDIIALFPPYKYVDIGPIKSRSGSVVTGIGIACPLLPEHFVTLKAGRVLKKIVKAVEIGERYGANIVGLGGFTSVFGNEGEEVAKYTKLPLTSGNTYTAFLAVEGIVRSTKLMGRTLASSTVAILGATGDIGSICTKILSKRVKRVILVARNDQRLSRLQEQLELNSHCEVKICKSAGEAVREADIILCVTSALTTIIEPTHLRSGAIVCDVAYPANITREVAQLRQDIFVFEGGMSMLPGYAALAQSQKDKLEKFNPPGAIHGCLAETILLALDNRYVYFSFGRGNITEEAFDQISKIAEKHGFGLAPFYCGNRFYSPDDIENIKRNVHAASGKTSIYGVN